jgi:hypothetical protein
MSCRRAFETDLIGFLADPRADVFADFRNHYPRCRACAAEVRAWTELEGHLRARAAGAPAHPSASLLARFDAAPEALEPQEREGLERHLAACPACRDELRALDAFAPERLGAAAPGPSFGRRLRERLAPLGRLAWHPGFAYALLALVLLPTVYATVASRRELRLAAAPPAGEAELEAKTRRAREELALADSEWSAQAHEKPGPAAGAPRRTGEADRAASAPAGRLAVPEAPAAVARKRASREEAFARSGADALAGAIASGDASAVLRLQMDRPVEVTAGEARGGLRLAIPLPPGLGEAVGGELRLRVTEANGRRELRERLAVAPGATEVGASLPGDWLQPGLYGVELAPTGDAAGKAAPARYSFRVQGPLP